jgi:hypothetical protein
MIVRQTSSSRISGQPIAFMLAEKNHAGNVPPPTFIVIDASVSSIPLGRTW